MTTHQIFVENIKCGGCANSIKNALKNMKGVTDVEIHKDDDEVCVTGVAIEREDLVTKLVSVGYPEKGNNNFISKAKSYLSCALGKYDTIK